MTTIILAGTVYWLWGKALSHQPSFYAKALSVPATEQQSDGEALERSVLELHNQLRHSGQWQVVFSQDQINGWLAWDLPEKFPGLLPAEVVEPRVAIEPDRMLVAFRYQGGGLDAVVTLTAELFLTDQPNEIGIRISKARAGLVPLSLRLFLDGISDAISSTGIKFRWAQDHGRPVALVTVPSNHQDYAIRDVQIDSLELRSGELVVAGRSGSAPSQRVASSSATNRTLHP